MQNLSNKELYQKISIENQHKLPFSLNYNWWNEVVYDNWDVAVVAKGDQVFAVMPYFIRKKGPWVLLTNPHFTPYCGPIINYPEGQKETSKIAFEHEIHAQLIKQLPKFAEYSQNFHLDFNNSLAFQWNEFQDSNRFTFVLDISKDEDELWSNLRENNRRQIKKAKKDLLIEECRDANLLEKMLGESFDNKIESEYFERIVSYIDKNKCGNFWKASLADTVHASILSIWDKNSAYYLIGGSAKSLKNSGAMSLLIWNAIQYAKKQGIHYFNFEGSSIPTIEKYLRGFGGELVSFRRITKNNSTGLQLAKKLKG